MIDQFLLIKAGVAGHNPVKSRLIESRPRDSRPVVIVSAFVAPQAQQGASGAHAGPRVLILPKDSEASVVFFSKNCVRGFHMVEKLTKSGNHTVGNPDIYRPKRHLRHLGLLFTMKKWCKKGGRTGTETGCKGFTI